MNLFKSMRINFLVYVLFFVLSSYGYSQTVNQDIIIPEFKKSSQVFNSAWESALSDIDSDGDLDLIFSSLSHNSSVLYNDGKGYFTDSGQQFPGGMHGIDVGDIDNDGDLDLFFAPLENNQPNPIYLNDGKGVFKRSNTNLSLGSTERIQLLDIENDGDLDAFLWWNGLTYLNDGKGIFKKSNTTWPIFSSFSDLNEDGFIDMIELKLKQGFMVYLNDKKGNFIEYNFLQKSNLDFGNTGFADIDNDGDIDIIFSNGRKVDNRPAGILLNDGTGKFIDSGQKLAIVSYGYVGTGDLNNDGFVDTIITDRENPPTVWINNGKGQFIDSGIKLGEGKYWQNCLIKDVDNDGDMDVFITQGSVGNNVLWFNQLINDKNR